METSQENERNGANSRHDALVYEVRRRWGIVHDQLIGQSPEDLPRHYRLIGQEEAFRGLLECFEKPGYWN